MNQIGTVKSAQRVFLILKDFAEKKRAQRASEIARSMKLPISSCVALLSTMVEQDVLFYNEIDRSYIPTLKLREFAGWLSEECELENRAIYFAKRLYRKLGMTTAVTRQVGLYLEWRFLRGPGSMSVGELRPLCKTVNGRAVLSHMSDQEISEFVNAHNECFGRENYIDPKGIFDWVRAARRAGYASGLAPLSPGFGAICFAMADPVGGDEVLLTVQVPAAELCHRENRIVDVARRMIPDLVNKAQYA